MCILERVVLKVPEVKDDDGSCGFGVAGFEN